MSTLDHFNRDEMVWRGARSNSISPAIMEGLDSMPSSNSDDNCNIKGSSGLHKNESTYRVPSLYSQDVKSSVQPYDECGSFLLIDGRENLKVSSPEQFVSKLNCGKDSKVKVVSIFGNTGDGKSHTLNRTFFDGREIFPTSNEQNSCTLGVWAAFDPSLDVICLDTEGLLGKKIKHYADSYLCIYSFIPDRICDNKIARIMWYTILERMRKNI